MVEVAAPVIVEVPVGKKLSRQESADKRKQLEPITKKIKQIEAKIEKNQKQLSDIEVILADAEIYTEANKVKLKQSLAEQAIIKKDLSDNEEQWLEYQDELEVLSN